MNSTPLLSQAGILDDESEFIYCMYKVTLPPDGDRERCYTYSMPKTSTIDYEIGEWLTTRYQL